MKAVRFSVAEAIKASSFSTGAGLSARAGSAPSAGRVGFGRTTGSRTWRRRKASRRDPVKVHEFYNLRRSWHKQAKPNAAHLALARLEAGHGNVLTVTQNIDGLHEAAGTRNLIHMHGELERALCAACGRSVAWTEDLGLDTVCGVCSPRRLDAA